jgi:hypothetical protein
MMLYDLFHDKNHKQIQFYVVLVHIHLNSVIQMLDVIMYNVVLQDKIHINNFDKELFVYDDFYNSVHDDKNRDHTTDNLKNS